MSDSVWPHRRQPTRLPHPWDSPDKNTGVGCHFLLQCRKVKSESEVAQSCLTLSDPMDCSLPGSSVHGIFQARALEWGAIAFSKTCNKQLEKSGHESEMEIKIWTHSLKHSFMGTVSGACWKIDNELETNSGIRWKEKRTLVSLEES